MSDDDKEIARWAGKTRNVFALLLIGGGQVLWQTLRSIGIVIVFLLVVAVLIAGYSFTDYLLEGGAQVLWDNFQYFINH